MTGRVAVHQINLVAADMDVLHVLWVDVKDLVDHAEDYLLVGVGHTRTDRLEVLLVLAKVLKLLELQDKLQVAVGLD